MASCCRWGRGAGQPCNLLPKKKGAAPRLPSVAMPCAVLLPVGHWGGTPHAETGTRIVLAVE